MGKGRTHSQTPRREQCFWGHFYDVVGWNVTVKPDGRVCRSCKECQRRSDRLKAVRRELAKRRYRSNPADPDVQRFRQYAIARGIKLRLCAG